MSGLVGTAALTRFALRRDRITLAVWVGGLAGLLAGMAAMSVDGLPTRQDVVQETELMAGNPGLRLLGLASGPSVGGYTMLRGYLTLAVLAALMSTFAVLRHTRQGEETGRGELVGAAPVGRYTGLAAAVLVTTAANLALVPLLALALVVNGQPVAGSFAAGAAVAAVGIAFTGVAAVAAQLTTSTRAGHGLAGAALGLAFLLSGVGNMLGHTDADGLRVTSAWPAWLSPIGWGEQMRPFGGDHWWPLGLFAAFFLVLLATAGVLAVRRDFGGGVLPERRGPAAAARGLLGPFGLVRRLERGALLGWAVGLLGFGLVFGALSGEVEDLEGAALDWYTRMGGTDHILDAYRASILAMAGMAVAVYVVQMLLRMRSAESDGTLEAVLASAVSRPRWAVSHLLNAVLGALGLLVLFAVSMALAAGAVQGDTAGQLATLTGAALVQLPAVLVIGGGVVAAVGLLPRRSAAVSWTVLVAAVLLGPLFGAATLGLPQGLQDLSPFTHVPRAPAVDVTATPVVALVALAAALAAVGLAALRRRDLRA